MPKISVLIPCHNADRWLEDAVNSIRRQTIHDTEIIIYDDGSTDNSSEIIDRLSAVDSRIVATGDHKNLGIVVALNHMLGIAQGEYIARMDADDISSPERFERQLQFIGSHGADLCGTWFREFGDGIPRAVRWPSGTEELRAAMLFQNSICHPTIMAKRNVFEEYIYRENYNLAEDYDLFVRTLPRFRLANIPEILLRYRRHPQQATRAKRAAMEVVTRHIRQEALRAQHIEASLQEIDTHNTIRSPKSIYSIAEFEKIESWLLKLVEIFDHPDAKRTIASQWIRASIRAAPLGKAMFQRYRRSPLHDLLPRSLGDIDLAILSILRIDYGSASFEALRRFGFSA